ncbi:MAG: NUDIX hydrolase [Eubacteriales bacterium]|nr:NUDIX hydrolase [Eubacteriales bacterium]
MTEIEKEYESLCEKYISGTETYHGPLLHVWHDRVRLPNGNEGGRDYIKHDGAVCMIPVFEDGTVAVERQFRYPLDRVITEIPAGKLNGPDEDRLEAAKRELREETGLSGDEWTFMGDLYCAVAYSTERISMYLVRSLHQGERRLDDDEFLNVERVPLSELVRQVMDGEIIDSKTQTAVLKAARILGI